MKHESQQRSQEQEQLSPAQQSAAREFATVEELLRHDAAHTDVPPAIAERLTQSIAKLPPKPQSWWQRWLKR